MTAAAQPGRQEGGDEAGSRKRPEWVPAQGGEGFATTVMKGVAGGHDGLPGLQASRSSKAPTPRRKLTVAELAEGIRAGNRSLLARGITLVESDAPAHQAQAQELLDTLLPFTGKALRVGITGVPGAGKSTTIDALGAYLCEAGEKVAVLAVDPSSTITKGSILGDKTRMEKLLRFPNAFVRPSPTGGTLGGVARKTRESVLLCEAYGCSVILLETVGVGQSEVTVRSMVDFFLLILIAGAGDELQGIKKGVIELADAIVVNKADGDNARRALLAKAEYNRVLSFLHPPTEGWKTKAYTASALTGEGIDNIWQVIQSFAAATRASGVFQQRRRQQNLDWMHDLLTEALRRRFLQDPAIQARLRELSAKVANGTLPPVKAVSELLDQ